jgi:catalase
VPRLVGVRIGPVASAAGDVLDADASLENEPGFLFDAIALPDGEQAVAALSADGHTMEFIKDQYCHCKTILAVGASRRLLESAGLPVGKGEGDSGLVVAEAGDIAAAIARFMDGLAGHRHFERETDPPTV